MSDYQKMYGILFRATEQAINTLIKAQRECEELYINEPETVLELLPKAGKEETEGEKT